MPCPASHPACKGLVMEPKFAISPQARLPPMPSACPAVVGSAPRRCATAAATVPITLVGCQPLPCSWSGSRPTNSAQTS